MSLHQAWAACLGCSVINDKTGQEIYKWKRQNDGYKLSANLADGPTL